MGKLIKVDFAKRIVYRNREETVKKLAKFESNHPWILRMIAVILILILSMLVL